MFFSGNSTNFKGLNHWCTLDISRPCIFPGPGKFQGVVAPESPGNFQAAGNKQGGPLEISRWWKIYFLNVRRNRHFHIKHKFESHPGWQFTISSRNHENICMKRWPSWLKSWLIEKNMTLLTPKWRNSSKNFFASIKICVNTFVLMNSVGTLPQNIRKIFRNFFCSYLANPPPKNHFWHIRRAVMYLSQN